MLRFISFGLVFLAVVNADDECALDPDLIERDYFTGTQSCTATAITDHKHAYTGVANFRYWCSPHRAVESATSNSGFLSEASHGFFECPDGEALVTVKSADNSRNVYTFLCSKMACMTVDTNAHWIYGVMTNYNKELYSTNLNQFKSKFNCDPDHEVACGACINDPSRTTDYDNTRCNNEDFAIKCCPITSTRSHCNVDPVPTNIPKTVFNSGVSRVRCGENPVDKSYGLSVIGGLSITDTTATIICSSLAVRIDDATVPAEIYTRFASGDGMRCSTPYALMDVTLGSDNPSGTCAKVECGSVDHTQCTDHSLAPNGNTIKVCPSDYVVTRMVFQQGTTYYGIRAITCCQLDPGETTVSVTHTATVVTTTTTKTTTTRTTVTTTITSVTTYGGTSSTTSTYSVAGPGTTMAGCNPSSEFGPESTCPDPSDANNYWNYDDMVSSNQWPCDPFGSVSYTGNYRFCIEFEQDVPGYVLHDAQAITHLHIRQSTGGSLRNIGDYAFAGMHHLVEISLPSITGTYVASLAFLDTPCLHNEAVALASTDGIDSLHCEVTTTTRTVTTTTETSSTTTNTHAGTIPDEDCSKVTCPKECTDGTTNALTYTVSVDPTTLRMVCCTTKHVCVHAPFIPDNMFANMESLESLTVTSSTTNGYLQSVGVYAFANLTNLHTFNMAPVSGGYANVGKSAYVGNPCLTAADDYELHHGDRVSVTSCVATTASGAATTAITTAASTTAVPTTAGSSGDSSTDHTVAIVVPIVSVIVVGLLGFAYYKMTSHKYEMVDNSDTNAVL